MWNPEINKIEKGIKKYKIQENGDYLNYREWLQLMIESGDFVKFFSQLLINNEFEGFFWEVKPAAKTQLNEPFEFVLVESGILPRIKANKKPFQNQLERSKNIAVTSFMNLGRDAKLIVPLEISESENYGHLAKFVRNAPKEQLIAFWKLVSLEYKKGIEEGRKWLSTAGLGVSWLHVRNDSRPKYYRYKEYKNQG